MNYKIFLYEDNEKLSFYDLDKSYKKSIEETIYNFAIDKQDCDGIELDIDLLDEDDQQITYGIICNVNEKKMSKFLNKKTVFNPPQYGALSWGNVELLFTLMNENEQQICKQIINKLKQDKIILDTQLEEQTEKLKNMKLKKSSKKKSNDNDDISISSNASKASKESFAATSISDITNISDISSTTIRKCSNCKLPGHNISKCPLISEKGTKDTKVSKQEKETKETKDAKVIKKCSNCKLPGHNINKCPSRNDISSNSVPDTDSENESKISKISESTKSEKEISVRKCSKCSTPGHTIRKCPMNNI